LNELYLNNIYCAQQILQLTSITCKDGNDHTVTGCKRPHSDRYRRKAFGPVVTVLNLFSYESFNVWPSVNINKTFPCKWPSGA